MFWLRTGTISLVQGSKNAVATGVSFVGEVKPGEILMVGGVLSEIERVVNATTIQLTVAWAAASVANQPYAVIRNITGATNFDLMKSIEAFLTDRQRSMDEFVEWINGAYNEGPNANGTFPMTDRYGVTLSVKSPPRLKWESDQLVSSLNVTLASANTQLTAIGNQTIWADQILGYKNEAVAARDKAQKWAEELVDVAVEAGKYSAKHHATKAAASLTDVTARQSDVVTRQANVVTRQTDVTTRQTDVTAKQTDVIARQTNVIALEASALASKNSATTSAATATTKASEASTSASQAVVSRDTAEKWASEADNVVVSAGKYSAKHYAGKALVSETAAGVSETAAEAAKVLAQTAKTGADTAKTGADTAKTAADTAKVAAQAAKTAAETAQAAAESARDTAVSAAASVTGGLVDLGQVSLAGGVYPTKPATYSSFWKVTTAGTVAAIPYGIGDTLVYSKTMDEFYKIDNTESVSSINGKTGAVVLENSLGTPLASAATVTVGTAGGAESRHITGNVQITSLGVSVTGVKRELIFDAGLIIVHNATSLVCPGAVNLITAAGMVVDVICENGASGYWRVTNISHSGVSATELGYLDGVSSSIQTQINAKEPSITSGTSAQLWLGNKTWVSVLSQVQGTLLTGYLVGANTDLVATDTVLAAFGKLQAQITGRLPLAGGTMTGPIDLNRSGATASGLSWYSPSYNTWQEYMGQAGVASQGVRGNVTPPVGSLVTSWGRRSYIENTAGYGWVFESAANGSGTPAIMMELSSNTGAAKFTGVVSGKVSGNSDTPSFRAPSTGGPYAGSYNRRAPFVAEITHTGSSWGPCFDVYYEYAGVYGGKYSLGHLTTSAGNPGNFCIHHLNGANSTQNIWAFDGATGGFNSPGAITAPSFSGSGAGLTGVAASTLAGSQWDWATYRSTAVANMLGWKNYGNGHVIFDASQSTSPSGGAVNNTNSAAAWSAGYPTLMGWNGSTTYGVRVDSARVADGTPWTGVSGKPTTLAGYGITNGYAMNGVNTGWFRSSSDTGWYNETFGGGIYMADTTYVRTYNGKSFLCNDAIQIDGVTPQVRLNDTNWGVRYLYHDAGVVGFLSSDGNWRFQNDNAGNTTSTGNITSGGVFYGNGSGLYNVALNDTGWLYPSLVNGFHVTDLITEDRIAYRKVGSTVTVVGVFRNASAAAWGTLIFTLPVGYRPDKNISAPCAVFADALEWKMGTIIVDIVGNVGMGLLSATNNPNGTWFVTVSFEVA